MKQMMLVSFMDVCVIEHLNSSQVFWRPIKRSDLNLNVAEVCSIIKRRNNNTINEPDSSGKKLEYVDQIFEGTALKKGQERIAQNIGF